MTTAWLPRHIDLISSNKTAEAPLITSADVRPVIEAMDIWDMWPLSLRYGSTADIAGGEIWMVLGSPKFADPDQRHDHARIRLLYNRDDHWTDCGDLLAAGFSPGSREWSGTAIFDPADAAVTLFFTAAGRADDPTRRFEQRLFQTTGRLELEHGAPLIKGWSQPVESVAADGEIYVRTASAPVEPGLIKGFRDPGYFRDAADSTDYLLFTGSLAHSADRYNGVIGVARAEGDTGDRWRLLEPLVSAVGVCNEMERPHIVYHDGGYYLFWSSQASAFAPDGPACPTGLYGMVASTLRGPYVPLNGSGLVIRNPAAAPSQAYCWWVTPDLRVHSFIDRWGPVRGDAGASADRSVRPFGGTFAPTLQLSLSGEFACLTL